MKTLLSRPFPLFLLLLTLAALGLSGCASDESENLSSRPWNAPRTSDYGLPGGMMEGH
jgi:hypothetical protein